LARKRLPETIAELFDYDSPSEASELSDTAAETRAGYGQRRAHDTFESSNDVLDVPMPPSARTRRSRKAGSRSADARRQIAPAEQPRAEASEADGPVVDKTVPPLRPGVRRQLTILAIAPILVATVGALILSALSPNLYAARSEIVFDVRRLGWDSAERFLATQVVIAESQSTLSPVAAAFELPIRELEKNLQVEIVSSSGVMRIQYENHNAQTALDVTKALTDRYLVSLREAEQLDGGAHRLLTPAVPLEDPVSTTPLHAAVLGAIAGLVIAAAGVILRTQLWPIR
jgi:capsular polysaccharide biosynthesis protein